MQFNVTDSLLVKFLRAFILLVVVIGSISLMVNYSQASKDIQETTLVQVDSLVNTVEPSAQIAAYLNDKSMSREIARGLIQNTLISYVEIRDSNGLALAENGRESSANTSHITRPVNSPFDSSVHVGEIHLQLDQAAMDERKKRYLMSVLLPTAAQTLAVVVAMIWAAMSVVQPQMRDLLQRMERLNLELGEHLPVNAKRTGNEIARTAKYINDLIDKMYATLHRERTLRHESELQHKKMEAIFDNARSGIFLCDREGRLLSFNHACQILSLRDGSTLKSNSLVTDIFSPDLTDTREQINRSLTDLTKLHLEIFMPAINGHRESWLQLSLTPIDDNSIQGIINDISSLKHESIAAQTLARTDALTQLGNRLGFEGEFSRRLNSTCQGEQSLTLMTIDLDKFKAVNDTFGHDAGDQVLMYVAHQLSQITRKGDYVCRMGGDEFNILLDNIDQERAEKMAARIVSQLSQAITLEPGKEVEIGASVGVVFVPKNCQVLSDDLLRKADKTMYRVKHGGRNNFAVASFADIA